MVEGRALTDWFAFDTLVSPESYVELPDSKTFAARMYAELANGRLILPDQTQVAVLLDGQTRIVAVYSDDNQATAAEYPRFVGDILDANTLLPSDDLGSRVGRVAPYIAAFDPSPILDEDDDEATLPWTEILVEAAQLSGNWHVVFADYLSGSIDHDVISSPQNILLRPNGQLLPIDYEDACTLIYIDGLWRPCLTEGLFQHVKVPAPNALRDRIDYLRTSDGAAFLVGRAPFG